MLLYPSPFVLHKHICVKVSSRKKTGKKGPPPLETGKETPMLGRKYFALQSTDKDNDYSLGKGAVMACA